MTVFDILPSGPARLVGIYLDLVATGVSRFGRGRAWFSAPAGQALSILRALTRLMRFALLICACFAPPPIPRAQTNGGSRRTRTARRMSFPLFPAFSVSEVRDDAPGVAPPAGVRDPWRAVADRLAMLSRVLADPAPVVARMTQRLPRQLMVIGWRPPKVKPRGPLREIHETLEEAWGEAWHQLREFRRRTREREACPASAA